MKRIAFLAVLLSLSVVGSLQAEHKYLKAFPKAKDELQRFVIELPHKDRKEEVNFRLELIVGKEMMTDGVNQVRLGGKIEPMPLKGWGFTFYEVKKLGPAMSTMMAAPGGKKVMRFVGGPSELIRYNSRIPVVIYVPQGAEVRYRIWEAPEDKKQAEAK